jgi:hypothetical protein
MPASHLNRTMATDAEMAAFRRQHAAVIASAGKNSPGAFDDTRELRHHQTLGAALKAKFGDDPRAVLRKLGLNERLLDVGFDSAKGLRGGVALGRDNETSPLPSRRAEAVPFDQEPADQDDEEEHEEEGEENPEIERILQLISEHVSPEALEACRQMLHDHFHGRGAQDEPPPFSGRPRAGGSMDPIVPPKARDALPGTPKFTKATGAPAMDAAQLNSFHERFGTARIRVDTMGVQPDQATQRRLRDRECNPQSKPPQSRPQQSAAIAMDARPTASIKSLEERFPGISRIKCL